MPTDFPRMDLAIFSSPLAIKTIANNISNKNLSAQMPTKLPPLTIFKENQTHCLHHLYGKIGTIKFYMTSGKQKMLRPSCENRENRVQMTITLCLLVGF